MARRAKMLARRAKIRRKSVNKSSIVIGYEKYLKKQGSLVNQDKRKELIKNEFSKILSKRNNVHKSFI